jgi:hypothetical protein
MKIFYLTFFWREESHKFNKLEVDSVSTWTKQLNRENPNFLVISKFYLIKKKAKEN